MKEYYGAILLLTFALPALAQERVEHGYALASAMCSQCHAIERADPAPHVAAPPFRSLNERLDLDDFVERLREGLTSGHPDMPTFRFRREDARALISYLRSIQISK